MTTTYPNGYTITGMLFALLPGASRSFPDTNATCMPNGPDILTVTALGRDTKEPARAIAVTDRAVHVHMTIS